MRFGNMSWNVVGEGDVEGDSPEALTMGVVDLLRFVADGTEEFVQKLRKADEDD